MWRTECGVAGLESGIDSSIMFGADVFSDVTRYRR